MGIVIYWGEQLLSQAFIGKGRKSQMPASMSSLPEGEHRWCFLWLWRELIIDERGQTYTKERKLGSFKTFSKSFFLYPFLYQQKDFTFQEMNCMLLPARTLLKCVLYLWSELINSLESFTCPLSGLLVESYCNHSWYIFDLSCYPTFFFHDTKSFLNSSFLFFVLLP